MWKAKMSIIRLKTHASPGSPIFLTTDVLIKDGD